MGSPTSPKSAPRQISGPWHADLPTCRPTSLPQVNHRLGWAALLRHPIACLLPVRVPRLPTHPPRRAGRGFGWLASPGSTWARASGYGNINPLSIDYACRPRLRSRLTLGGLAWPRNPWSSGGRVSHPAFATHACILTRVASTTGSLRRFTRHTTLPYPPTHLNTHHKGRMLG
jgi:hypothetical protein